MLTPKQQKTPRARLSETLEPLERSDDDVVQKAPHGSPKPEPKPKPVREYYRAKELLCTVEIEGPRIISRDNSIQTPDNGSPSDEVPSTPFCEDMELE